MVSTVCQKYGWDVEWVVTYLLKIKHQTTTDTLHPILLEGDMHVDPNSIATTMYKPHSYSQRQRQQLQDFLMTNGYITSEWATRQGLSIMQVTTLLQQQQQQQQQSTQRQTQHSTQQQQQNGQQQNGQQQASTLLVTTVFIMHSLLCFLKRMHLLDTNV